MLRELFVLLCLAVVGLRAQPRPPPPERVFECQPITEITICNDIEYDNATFPNFRNHFEQSEANEELNTFRSLICSHCSNAIVTMLCAYYAPFCSIDFPDLRVSPCRDLCEYVRDGCEDTLSNVGLFWPEHLECEQFNTKADDPLCFQPDDFTTVAVPITLGCGIPPNITMSPPTEEPDNGTEPTPSETIPSPTMEVFPSPSSTPTSTPSSPSSPSPSATSGEQCPIELRVPEELENESFSFADISDCGVNCRGIYFTDNQRNVVAPVLILLFALACVVFTLFTVATFLIDRRRFHYPERPIIFLSFCYLVIGMAYVVGAVSKLVEGRDSSFACTSPDSSDERPGSQSFVFQGQPKARVDLQSFSCIILFVMVYYFQMASAIWWVVLTLTWFLAAAMKWGEEAVERLWLLYHIIAWLIPAIQLILTLALQFVDGDQLAGLCYPGNFNTVALGVFVFMPLSIYLTVGIVFLAVGFTALLNIRRELDKDPVKSKKLTWLIVRIAVYSSLYTIPNIVFLLILIYEMAEREDWERHYVSEEGCRENISGHCTSAPDFAAFVLKYLALFTVGICSCSWVMSRKTFLAWKKFFESLACRSRTYEIPIMTVKPPHPTYPSQTAV